MIKIRPATVADAKKIAQIHVETWQSAYRGLLSDEYLNSLDVAQKTANWRQRLFELKELKQVFVALVADEIVGFIWFGENQDADLLGSVGEMYAIYVHPSSQNQGVGKSLIQFGIETLKKRGFKKITLWVLECNQTARKFYESQGWMLEGKKKIDVRQGEELREIRYFYEF